MNHSGACDQRVDAGVLAALVKAKKKPHYVKAW